MAECLSAGAVKELKLVSLECCALPPLIAAGELQWPDFHLAISQGLDTPPTPPPLA